jgi:uroporphyrinogen III methyltransferase/synthase
MSGRVYLVGAGPGDPGLLTLKGRRCLERAEVIVYDYLADRSLLAFAPPGAATICVGKHGGGQRTEQEEINRLLLEHARAGKTVVRLKGGDPFIFGRGAEEAEELARHGIPFDIVPGVTSGTAVPAYAGIPLTHRDLSSTVAFIAGYEYPEKAEPTVPWTQLARGIETLVLFMTTRQLRHNMQRLIAAGLDPDTPAAVIRWGTRAGQETIVGTAATIGDLAARRRLQPPALAVIGQVVRLRETLRWFERKPLFGRRIVVTRAREQASRFGSILEDWGAEVVYFPTIEIRPPESWEALDRAIAAIADFDWVVFTSVNGVAAFVGRLDVAHRDLRTLHGVRIAAIGPETARAVEQLHLRVAAMPCEYRAEGVLTALGDVRGRRILLPRAAGARAILPRELERRGAQVTEVLAYRSVSPQHDTGALRRALEAGEIHLVTFTSSSTVRHFAQMFPEGDILRLLANTEVGCIGPITAATAEEVGLRVALQPVEYTVPAFAEAIRAHYAGRMLNAQC